MKKRGQPYSIDCLVTKYTEVENCNVDNMVIIVKEKKCIKMVMEVKKLVGKTMLSLEPPDLLELFIYCYYTLRNCNQDRIQGVLTDGLNWHCFDQHLIH